MLSEIRHFGIVDEHQRRAKLYDLSVDVLESDYPPVAHLFFHNDQKQRTVLPWGAVKSINWRHRCIEVTDLEAGQVVEQDSLQEAAPSHEVLLGRDILDALIIDLEHRRATRANDLWLQEEDGQLLLRSADTSLQAMLRRLTHGRLGSIRQQGLYDWKYIEFLRGDPQAVRSGAGYSLRIRRLPPGEIARLTDALPYLHAAELLILLPDPIAADTLEAMAPERQLQVFEEMDEEQGIRLLELMAPDIAADLVGRLLPTTAQTYLNRLTRKQGERILELLRYPEDTVGGIMTNDVVSVSLDKTVGEAKQLLRDRLKEPDFVHFIYIVSPDEGSKLRGVISLRELFVIDEDHGLEEVMNSYVVTLHALEPAREACHRVISSHLAGLPVVGREGQLLGAVTIDIAVSQVAPAALSAQIPRIFS